MVNHLAGIYIGQGFERQPEAFLFLFRLKLANS
jgi:hypothetical protein